MTSALILHESSMDLRIFSVCACVLTIDGVGKDCIFDAFGKGSHGASEKTSTTLRSCLFKTVTSLSHLFFFVF